MHTKYIKRGGKLYGPYYYESYREGNKVKKRYISPEEFNLRNKNAPKKIFGRVKSQLFYSAILLFVIIGVIFLLYNAQPTGKVNLAIETHYTQGEPLSGFLRFNLKQGELIPKDSKVVVSLGGEQKEFLLSELIDSGSIYSGDFFAEDSSLSGSGEGYGFAGSKLIYPEVNFELIIFSASAEDGSDG
ncbi:MAG TPA: hypothetical protein VI544_02235, partial [Candidatus Nanoarchaeia archaeon]|nr:hypothetical protein [Candidatus Nanoarchaeia archaeon]